VTVTSRQSFAPDDSQPTGAAQLYLLAYLIIDCRKKGAWKMTSWRAMLLTLLISSRSTVEIMR